MTLPIWTTNPNTSLSTTEIQTEFGGEAPTNMSEYFRGGPAGYVTGDRVGYPNGVATPIPLFGNALSISNFYGASAVSYSISANAAAYNEGSTMLVNVTAPEVNGTVLYWTIEDTTSTITISPATLTNGVRGGSGTEPVSQLLTASGGTAPYTFSVIVGSLPAGVTLTSTGLLSGFPSSAGVTTFTVQAIDSQGNGGVRQYSLSILNASYLPLTLPSGAQGSAYSQQLSVSGGTAPYVYSVIGNLPAGLTISSSGLISGTPTVNGTFNATIRVVFNGGSVGDPGITISYSNWSITNVPTYGASTIGPSPLPIGYSSQSYSQQLTFTGDVVAPVTFVQAATPGATHSGNGAPYINPLPAGVTLSSSGLLSGSIGQNIFGLVPVWVTATDSRQHSVTSLLNWTIIRITTGRIEPASLPAGTQNTAYNQQLSVTQGPGGPYKFATTGSLPTGLSLTSAGLLSGTPAVTGTFPINIVAGYDTDDSDPTNDYDRYTTSYSLVIGGQAEYQLANGMGFSSYFIATGTTPQQAYLNADIRPDFYGQGMNPIVSGVTAYDVTVNYTLSGLVLSDIVSMSYAWINTTAGNEIPITPSLTGSLLAKSMSLRESYVRLYINVARKPSVPFWYIQLDIQGTGQNSSVTWNSSALVRDTAFD